MSIKRYKPTTPGRRFAASADFSVLTKKKPEKSLTLTKKKTGGRNSQGKITVRHHGGGHKQKLRIIDWTFEKDTEVKVLAIEYDPNRSARLALVESEGEKRRYILAAENIEVGQTLALKAQNVDVKTGNRTKLEHIPTGTPIHNIELEPGKGGKLVRSAGANATVMASEGGFVQVKLPSSEVRTFFKDCMATIGAVSNSDHRNIRLGKAGRMRWLGVRPTVRGKAMNPVDHPHGGGEGHNPIGLKHPKTRQGKPALGVRTRKADKRSNRFIVSKRAKKH